jgi:hypothetical protein
VGRWFSELFAPYFIVVLEKSIGTDVEPNETQSADGSYNISYYR